MLLINKQILACKFMSVLLPLDEVENYASFLKNGVEIAFARINSVHLTD